MFCPCLPCCHRVSQQSAMCVCRKDHLLASPVKAQASSVDLNKVQAFPGFPRALPYCFLSFFLFLLPAFL